MEKELQVFKNDMFEVAVKLENGEIAFDAETVAVCLNIGERKNGKFYVKWSRLNSYLGKNLSTDVAKGDLIPESAVYKLAFKASNDIAERFQDWLATEVIPSIRKHGAYMTGETLEKALTSPDFLIQLATKLKEEQEARKLAEMKLEEQKPLVTFAETCIKSKDNILVRQLSKIANDEGIDIGEKRLYNKLREWGLIMKHSTEPYQYGMDRDWFVVEENSINTPYGVKLTKVTKVTPKGQVYIIEKLKKENK